MGAQLRAERNKQREAENANRARAEPKQRWKFADNSKSKKQREESAMEIKSGEMTPSASILMPTSSVTKENLRQSKSAPEPGKVTNPLHEAMSDGLDEPTALPESYSPKPLRFVAEEDSSANGEKKRKVINSPTLIRRAQQKNKKSRLDKLKGEKFEKFKSQSTATMFVDNTINAPDIQQVIECMATALDIAIRAGPTESCEGKIPKIFSEKYYPLDAGVDLDAPPMKLYIEIFLGVVFKAAQLSGECGVMCMAYIDRLVRSQEASLLPENWRRVVLGALMLASKVWEDQAVWNVDFITDETFPNLDVHDLNALEREYLNLIGFDVNLKAGEYAKYYFELKSLLPPHTKDLLLQPLNQEKTEKLEKRSNSVAAAESVAQSHKLRETL